LSVYGFPKNHALKCDFQIMVVMLNASEVEIPANDYATIRRKAFRIPMPRHCWLMW
jgi:hypothetical protein